ncbi:MAG TPA: DNA-binding protein [Rhodobacteraceae bacterium]|nr:DNA-binding protein [Paracoccaceae bacterium]
MPELRKKQLIEDVVARSGIKKKYAKPVIEAMLAELGKAVAEGVDINLKPFGKITMQKQNEKATARVTIARIRQQTAQPETPVKDPLAEAAE